MFRPCMIIAFDWLLKIIKLTLYDTDEVFKINWRGGGGGGGGGGFLAVICQSLLSLDSVHPKDSCPYWHQLQVHTG